MITNMEMIEISDKDIILTMMTRINNPFTMEIKFKSDNENLLRLFNESLVSKRKFDLETEDFRIHGCLVLELNREYSNNNTSFYGTIICDHFTFKKKIIIS